MPDKFTGSKDVLADKEREEHEALQPDHSAPEVPWGADNPPPHGVNLGANDPDHDIRQPVLNPNTAPQPRSDYDEDNPEGPGS